VKLSHGRGIDQNSDLPLACTKTCSWFGSVSGLYLAIESFVLRLFFSFTEPQLFFSSVSSYRSSCGLSVLVGF